MSKNIVPSANLLLSHLGLPLETLDQSVFAYADSPDFELPDHSPIGGAFFKDHGLSITFCAPDFYHVNDALTNHPAIITNVQFYSGESYYNHARYEGELPFGLSFDDDRAAVIDKLGQGAWRFPLVAPFKLERFDLPDRWILVKYADDGSGISMIQIGLKPKKSDATVLPKILQPDIHALQSMLTRSWDIVSEDDRFEGIDLSGFCEPAAEEDCPDEIDALPTHGVELYFRQSKETIDAKSVLSGARYIRKGLNWSSGFDGDLPMGIGFDDTPEQFLAKVGCYPVTGKANVLTGYYVWRLPEHLLHIGYSVMEQRINRIYIAAHSYYSPSLLESPLLELPT
ncbi:hypothetical protein [Pseudoduganella lutea]|uniref:Uncharacterized protein n=1 Tax=Pseudoduganella lutea TaxID=321985 RepID=A0A4P6KRN7_9BURK|nr:hypothetical protein [Pseudoduganella lutea]QBE61739.1 hypothetical protein EWM63_00945 [Pseudoduganella lutea]